MKIRFLSILLCCLFLLIGQAHAETWEQRLQSQIKVWTNQLSGHTPLFKHWDKASYKIEPLGPNSKQWLVTLTYEKKNLGYLVIAENEKQEFILLEYGTEPISLFDPRLISVYYPELAKMAKVMIKQYFGLESHFLIKTKNGEVIIDGKTGERIPEEFHKSVELKVSISNLKPPVKLESVYVKELSEWEEAFPIEVIIGKTEKLSKLEDIERKDTYLRTTTWNGKMNQILPVVGYHKWSDEIVYVAIDHEGYRFLPLQMNKTDGGSPSVSISDIIVVAPDS
jgi:hypothetical protein